MWYWPIRLDELLTASLETYLLSDETAMTTMESPVSDINFKDYTSELEELVPLPGDAYPNNPMYEVADYYHPMQTALDRLNSRDGIRESASARNRYAYKLGSSNGYIKLNTFTSNECPKRLRLCRNGLSVGFWMHVPTTLVAVDTIADIIQLDGVFALSLFRETLNIFVGEEGTNGVFRILHAVPRDVWFNLGVSIHTAPIHHIQAFYNGMSVPVQQVEVPPRNGSSKETLNYSLFIGSKLVFQGAKGVSLNDLTMWYRALYNFESHRFVGYTRLQLEHLSRASHYWTPDIFLFQDSPSHIKMRQKYKYLKQREDGWNIGGSGYALASIYKSVKGTFRYDTLDYMNKSTVPVFEMHPNQYMVLGREKSSTPTLRNIVWDKHCLHNPSERLCGVRGFTISMWIKIITVSTARLRFYLNSGDSGTSSLTVRDYRGVTIFSEASLLGVSVSQRYTDWKLVSDSNSYKQGQWINIGILWDEKGGLAMLLDGVNYGIRDTKGDKVLKERLAPPHVVLGRLDDEDESTWLSPRQANIKAEESNGQLDPRWEMSHFALGEIVYYDRRISHNEYKSQLGVIGVPAFRRFQGYLWHGVELIDPPISHLASALKQKIVRPGPVLSDNAYSKVVLLRDPDAVELINGSSLRIGVLEENHCTRQVSFCSEGLSIGAWIRIGRPKFGADRDSEEPIILFTGANGRFGMAAKQNGHEVSAWVVPNATETQHADLKHGCWCTTIAEELVKRTTNLQWIHYALIWEPSTDGRTDTLHIAINGRIRAKCAQLKENNQNPESKWAHGAALRAAQLYTDTNTPGSAYLLISSTSLSSVGGTMAVAIVAMKSRVLADSSLMELMGLEYPQYLNMRASTFYWPFSGLLKELTPGRLRHSGVTYTLDKYDAQDGALCTDSTEHSYIALMGDAVDTVGGTNLVDACVVNPTPCGSFVFSMELKRRPFPFNNNESGDFEHELFRSTPLDSQSDLVGLYITLSADTRVLVITVRTEFVTMTNYVEIDQVQINKWNKFEIIYTPKGLKVLSGDSVIGAMEKTVTQTKMNLPLSSIAKINHHMYIGRGFPVCVSDVSTLDVPAGQDAENFIRSGLSTYCYTDTDLLIDFRGEHPDHLGLPNSATRIVELASPIKIDKAPCFLRPKECTSNEFTVSVWVRIDALYDPSHDKNPVETPTPMSAVLFTTGLPGRSGVTMNVTSKVTGNHTRKMDLAIRVYAGSEKWSLNSRNVIQLGEWVNLAVHWNSASEDRLGNLEIYINGTRKQSSSRPRRSSRPPQHDLTLGRLYFNKAYAEGQRNGGNIAEPLINGLIHNFAYWSSNPTTCFGPRSTKRKLLGECLTDPTLPETTTCTHIGDCEHAYGAVCLDPTVGNFRKMAEQANLLVDPKDFYRILSVGLDLVKEYEEKDQTKFLLENEMTLIKSILVFMRRWPHALRLACESWDSLHCRELQLEKDRFIQLLMKVAVSTSSSRWQDAWRELPKQGAIRADDLTSSASGMMQAIGSASLTPEEHHLNCSVHTSSGTAAILMINFKSPCPPAVIHLESQSHIHSKNLGHAVFTIRRDVHQNNTIQIGVVTLLGFPAANKTDILVAGGLKRKQFSERTLQGYKNSIFTPNTEAEEAILTVRKSASKLEIQSPVFVCNANPENMMGTKNLDDTILQFVIELSELNEHEATYFYRTTGRKRWKALESTMEQKVEGKGSWPLTYPVRCVRWETYVDGREMWDDACCFVTGANRSHVRCACNCLGVFAVAMEPRDAPGRRRPIWMAWGASSQLQHASWIEGLLVAINGLSAVCSLLLTFILIMFLRKTTFKGPYTIRCILSAVYVVLHAVLLSVPYTEQRHIPCVSAGLLLHLSAVLSSSWQFCEVLTLFRSFVLGNFAINGLWIWTIGLISPLIVVGLPAGLSKLKEHGEDILCLPAHESNVFWTMFGIIFTYEAASITISLVTACNLETPAYLKPKVLEQLL
ncbi:unnamed protein product [Dicrocoelium dendriticum]|nr:unnamed protein product [Dicrocoelium dendriticum]